MFEFPVDEIEIDYDNMREDGFHVQKPMERMKMKSKFEDDFKVYSQAVKNIGKTAGVTNKQGIVDMYNHMGENYDEVMQEINYNCPFVLTKYLDDMKDLNKETTKFMDFGCGTGIMGDELKKVGFGQFDCIDGNAAFVNIAKKRGVYQESWDMWLGMNDGSYPANLHDKYDVVISTGCFMKDHFPKYVLDDMHSTAKAGGYIIFTCRDFDFDSDACGMGYGEHAAAMEAAGKITRLDRFFYDKNPASDAHMSAGLKYFMAQKGSVHCFRVNKNDLGGISL